MKKILFTLLFSMMICSSCFAAGVGPIFSAEELVTDKFVATLLGNGGYSIINSIVSSGMRANITEQKFMSLRSDFQKNFGPVDNYQLMGFQRNNKQADSNQLIDIIEYFAVSKKNDVVSIRVAVVNEKGAYRVHGFMINEVAATRNPK